MLILELKSCLLKIKKKSFVLQLVEDGYYALLFLKRKVLYPPLVIFAEFSGASAELQTD